MPTSALSISATSYNPNHIDKQDHLCLHLGIHLNTEVDMEGLDGGCDLRAHISF